MIVIDEDELTVKIENFEFVYEAGSNLNGINRETWNGNGILNITNCTFKDFGDGIYAGGNPFTVTGFKIFKLWNKWKFKLY